MNLTPQASTQKSAALQERDAYAHPEYLGLLAALKVAVAATENSRWMLIAAQTRVEVWRSQNASNRQIDRTTA